MFENAVNNSNDIVYYRGQLCKVISNLGEHVTIELLNGEQISVKFTELKNTAIWEYQAKQSKEREEQIAHYRAQAEQAGKEKNNWIEKIHDLWSKMLGLDESDAQYAQLKDEYWSARFKKTAASNSEYSNYMSAFMVASDPIV